MFDELVLRNELNQKPVPAQFFYNVGNMQLKMPIISIR